ncbi:MAG: hypothetical protein LBR58_07260 [Propionibacteriaceae bacterium]|jgi:uncharacterized protein YukE|nr:hypothetical protein [Propionibacteriaceae bacterium]
MADFGLNYADLDQMDDDLTQTRTRIEARQAELKREIQTTLGEAFIGVAKESFDVVEKKQAQLMTEANEIIFQIVTLVQQAKTGYSDTDKRSAALFGA